MASEAQRALEAILMVAEEAIAPHLLAQLLEISPGRVEALCAEIAESYVAEDRGFVLARVAGGYRFQSHPDLAPYVERFVLEGQSAKLSAAALETMAIVAYKQPVSRAQVSSIRGVNVDGVMRTLQQRGLITEIGRDPGPGQAVLYGTTPLFLEKMGLDSLDHLPSLADFVPRPEVMEVLEQGLRHDGDDDEPKSTDDPIDSVALGDSMGASDPARPDNSVGAGDSSAIGRFGPAGDPGIDRDAGEPGIDGDDGDGDAGEGGSDGDVGDGVLPGDAADRDTDRRPGELRGTSPVLDGLGARPGHSDGVTVSGEE